LGMQRFRGKIPLRVSPDLHRRLKIEAAERDVSLNHYLVTKLASER
jgi:predicted HicB family RNase H-like nuclease